MFKKFHFHSPASIHDRLRGSPRPEGKKREKNRLLDGFFQENLGILGISEPSEGGAFPDFPKIRDFCVPGEARAGISKKPERKNTKKPSLDPFSLGFTIPEFPRELNSLKFPENSLKNGKSGNAAPLTETEGINGIKAGISGETETPEQGGLSHY